MGYSQGGAMAALVTGLVSARSNEDADFILNERQLEYPDHIPHFKGIQHPPMYVLPIACR